MFCHCPLGCLANEDVGAVVFVESLKSWPWIMAGVFARADWQKKRIIRALIIPACFIIILPAMRLIKMVYI
jgi:hypothetical protein